MKPAILKVRLYGDPCLRKKSVPVEQVGPAERLLIRSMLATMHQHKGIGLAAPQVGVNQRILVADIGDGPIVVINPKILRRLGTDKLEEGCLSIPGINVEVKRAQKIYVKYLDENNQQVERVYSNLMARVILHETDHLDGKLIVDYVGLLQKKKIDKILANIEKGIILEPQEKTVNSRQ